MDENTNPEGSPETWNTEEILIGTPESGLSSQELARFLTGVASAIPIIGGMGAQGGVAGAAQGLELVNRGLIAGLDSSLVGDRTESELGKMAELGFAANALAAFIVACPGDFGKVAMAADTLIKELNDLAKEGKFNPSQHLPIINIQPDDHGYRMAITVADVQAVADKIEGSEIGRAVRDLANKTMKQVTGLEFPPKTEGPIDPSNN